MQIDEQQQKKNRMKIEKIIKCIEIEFVNWYEYEINMRIIECDIELKMLKMSISKCVILRLPSVTVNGFGFLNIWI